MDSGHDLTNVLHDADKIVCSSRAVQIGSRRLQEQRRISGCACDSCRQQEGVQVLTTNFPIFSKHIQ